MALQEAVYPLTASVVLLSIAAAVVPAVFFVSLIYWFDRYEKEPLWLISAAFFWGAVPSIVLAFIINTISSLVPYFVFGPEIGDVFGASFIAPVVEESLKGFALIAILLFWRHELDSPLDGIIYGAMVGVGFAMVENIYYFVTVYSEGGGEALGLNIFMRAFIFGLNHALFTSMTGLGIAVARLTRRRSVRYGAPAGGWMLAMFLHFVHNFSASLAGVVGPLLCLVTILNAWGGLLIVLVIIIWALVQEKRWIRKYLQEEVSLGTLSHAQYLTASSSLKRLGHDFTLLTSKGLAGYFNSVRFFQKCSELAYKKHHFTLLNDTRDEARMRTLRLEIARLNGLIS